MSVNPAEIESELLRLSGLLEERTEELAKHSQVAAETEHAYKLAEGRALIELSKQKVTADVRKALALVGTAELHESRLLAAAVRDSAQEACRSLRAQLSALQSINGNYRGITG